MAKFYVRCLASVPYLMASEIIEIEAEDQIMAAKLAEQRYDEDDLEMERGQADYDSAELVGLQWYDKYGNMLTKQESFKTDGLKAAADALDFVGHKPE